VLAFFLSQREGQRLHGGFTHVLRRALSRVVCCSN
jgi:hypothetical protein